MRAKPYLSLTFLSMDLDKAIVNYELALTLVEVASSQSKSKLPSQLIAEVLIARDAVEYLRGRAIASSNDFAKETKTHLQIAELDQRLRKQAKVIENHIDLEAYRQSIKPESSAWWWFLKSKPKESRFSWIWNGFTVVFLVSATSLVTTMAQAFSVEGFDLIGIFSSFSQGAGLALVAGGAFTESGKKTVKNVLKSLSIPSHYYAQATFIFAITIFVSSLGIYSNLYRLGDFYYSQGNRERRLGDNVAALQSFQKAVAFSPDKKEVYSALGQVSEKMGRLDDAVSYYEQGVSLSEPAAALGMGRITLLKALQEIGWLVKIEDDAVNEVENFLELAAQFNAYYDENGDILETVDVVIESYTHFGLLELAKIDLSDLSSLEANIEQNSRVRRGLKNASRFFKRAHVEELVMLSTPSYEDEGILKGLLAKDVELVSQLGLDSSDFEQLRLHTILGSSNALEDSVFETIDKVLRNYIDDLPDEKIEQLTENITFDLLKPRCYLALSKFIDSTYYLVNDLANDDFDENEVSALKRSRKQINHECGASNASSSPSRAQSLDIFSLSLYDKMMMSKLLNSPRDALPEEVYE